MCAAEGEELLARRLDEVEALKSLFECEEGGRVAVEGREGDEQRCLRLEVAPLPVAGARQPVKVCVALCEGYPDAHAGVVLRAAPDAPGADEANAAAEAVIEESEAECLYECLEAMREALQAAAEAKAAEAARRKKAQAAFGGGDDEERHFMVVRLDHMNSRATYSKALKKISKEFGVGVRLLWQDGGARRPGGASGAMLCLCSPDGDALGAFGAQLRAQYVVDVDSRGERCKERQATTLCRRGPGDVKPGEDPAVAFDGFEDREYTDASEMESLLAELNLLHVGAGGQRFRRGGE